jgi:hypothetical protein
MFTIIKKYLLLILTSFRVRAHPEAGRNTFFQPFSTVFSHFSSFLLVFPLKTKKEEKYIVFCPVGDWTSNHSNMNKYFICSLFVQINNTDHPVQSLKLALTRAHSFQPISTEKFSDFCADF